MNDPWKSDHLLRAKKAHETLVARMTRVICANNPQLNDEMRSYAAESSREDAEALIAEFYATGAGWAEAGSIWSLTVHVDLGGEAESDA